VIDYQPEADRFVLRTSAENAQISSWLGWRRIGHCCYAAPAYVTSILSVRPLAGVDTAWTPAAGQKRHDLLAAFSRARTYLEGTSQIPLRRASPTAREPKVHQQRAIHALREMGWRALLTDQMGLGKTSTALWAAYDARVSTIVVICPVSVKFNWHHEIEATLGEKWGIVVIDGTPKQRADQISTALQISKKGNIAVVINYDLLQHLSDDQFNWLAAMTTGNMLILDESHYLKNRKAKRSALVDKIAKQARYVLGLTGTPIRNLAEDLWQQIEIVRPGLFTSYADFAKRHLVVQAVTFGKRTISKVVATRDLDGLSAAMNTLQIKRKKSEVLDLPPKVHTFPELEIDGDLLKLYKAMKEFARIELSKVVAGNVCVDCNGKGCNQCGGSGTMRPGPISIFNPRAKSAVEQAMRCEQIAQGFIGGIPDPVMQKLGASVLKGAEKIPGRPNELIFPDSPKVVWLLEMIESVLREGGAPIVYSRFNAPIIWLATHLHKQEIKVGLLHGGLNASDRAATVTAFQDRKIAVLISQVKIAEGWNAPRSQDVFFLGRDWSPAVNEQAEDRAHRMGQKGTVNVQAPIVMNTIERMIDRRLRAKSADAEQALRNVTLAELMEAL
jgi:SNF2 family DNA or RNA helicase